MTRDRSDWTPADNSPALAILTLAEFTVALAAVLVIIL